MVLVSCSICNLRLISSWCLQAPRTRLSVYTQTNSVFFDIHHSSKTKMWIFAGGHKKVCKSSTRLYYQNQFPWPRTVILNFVIRYCSSPWWSMKITILVVYSRNAWPNWGPVIINDQGTRVQMTFKGKNNFVAHSALYEESLVLTCFIIEWMCKLCRL